RCGRRQRIIYAKKLLQDYGLYSFHRGSLYFLPLAKKQAGNFSQQLILFKIKFLFRKVDIQLPPQMVEPVKNNELEDQHDQVADQISKKLKWQLQNRFAGPGRQSAE